MLANSGEAAQKPNLNPVEKALSTDVHTLVAKASLAYPILCTAAADPALHAMMIAELVSLLLEDTGGVVLPVGQCTHPLPLNEWKDFKENLAGLDAHSLPHVQAQFIHMGLVAAQPVAQELPPPEQPTALLAVPI